MTPTAGSALTRSHQPTQYHYYVGPPPHFIAILGRPINASPHFRASTSVGKHY